jgi:flagellar L-ring protein precursor FlgH
MQIWQKKMKLSLATAIVVLGGSWTADAEPANGKAWTMAARLCADQKACRVGDILTVLIVEQMEASKDAKSTSGKVNSMSGSASVQHPQVDGKSNGSWTSAALPGWQLDTSQSFEGGGTAANKDTFLATMSVTVRDLLPNGNMLIEGTRSVVIRDDRVNVILSGIIRPQDVSGENTILSSKIADAAIRYESTGTLARNQEKGFLLRALEWINPF